MKHLIIGAGVVGKATGIFLEAHNEEVWYHDNNLVVLEKFKNICPKLKRDFDVYWICTPEWSIDDVLGKLKKYDNIIIRSTIRPDIDLNKFNSIAHIPEFLREKTAINDIFNSDRTVVGIKDDSDILKVFISMVFYPNKLYFCSIEESALIKLIANGWLALQISFWNEVQALCKSFKDVDPQFVSDIVTMDKRISKYGSNMIAKPFAGFCFPKDTRTLEALFRTQGVCNFIITALRKTNVVFECQGD